MLQNGYLFLGEKIDFFHNSLVEKRHFETQNQTVGTVSLSVWRKNYSNYTFLNFK
jgi:hypothetical protein